MKKWIKKHIRLFIASCIAVFLLLLGVPFAINLLFKIPATSEVFRAEWDAGDALGYYGAVLSFIGTVVLGILALYQNHIIKADADKQSEKWAERERIENMPRFVFKLASAGGYCENITLSVLNTSPNSAYDIRIYDLKLMNENNVLWSRDRSYIFHSINAHEEIRFGFKAPPVVDKKDILIKARMVCKDKFNVPYEYILKMECYHPNRYENAEITEVLH